MEGELDEDQAVNEIVIVRANIEASGVCIYINQH